ncbi:MAG: tetratricopeptide repeat protein [Chloroflexota bacterium]
MKTHTNFSTGVFLITIGLALAACWPAAVTVPAATSTATRLFPTRTKAAQIFSPTIEAPKRLQQTDTPSPTPAPLVTSLFPVSLELPYLNQTSTPVATPEKPDEEFKRKAWGEEDAVALIKALDEYASANDRCFPAGCMRNNFVSLQEPIALALQETLWRFPKTAHQEQYQWRLALAHAIQGSHASDAWILAKLETLFNQSELPLEALKGYIKAYGFTLRSPYPDWDDERPNTFPNLFGDQTDAVIYRLTTQGSYLDGLFFTVHTDTQGSQKLVPIYSDWNFFTAGYSIADFADHNLNGIPEVVLYAGRYSGTMCSAEIFIFEWQGDRFVQRIDEEHGIEIGLMNCENGWGYGQRDENGIARLFSQGFSTTYTDHFKWDGALYRFDERTYEAGTIYDLALTLETLTDDGNFREAIDLLENTLPSDPEYAPDSWDYFRFQLGMFYATQSEIDRARTQFQYIADRSSSSSSTSAVPQAAQAFLDRYTDNASIYHACMASLDVMQKALDPFRDDGGHVTEEQMRQAWRYADTWPFYPLCNPDLVLPYLARQLTAEQTADVSAALRQAGVSVEYSTRLDMDGDGDQDWLIVITKPPATGRADATVWALLQEVPGLLALRVSSDHDHIDRASARKVFVVETATPPDGHGKPIMIVQSGNSLSTFQVLGTADSAPYIQDVSGYWWKVMAYSLEDSAHGTRIRITFPDPAGGSAATIESYLWDNEVNRFDREEDVLKAIAERATESLRQEGEVAGAIPALQAIVRYAPPVCDESYPEECDMQLTERARYHYLLALAYERAGDDPAAVQAYWQLWHDFPHSPYALMARAKLVHQ